MQAILTKVISGTNTRPTKIKAYSSAGVTLLSDMEDPTVANLAFHEEGKHRAAAYKLANILNWKGQLIGGSTPDGYAFVFIPEIMLDE